MQMRDYTDERVRDRRAGGEPLARLPRRDAPAEHRRGGWRDTVAGASGLNVLAGIWLIIAPWVLAYSAGDPKWNDVICGAIVVLLALYRMSGVGDTSWAAGINLVVGAWLFASAFWLDDSGTAGANDIILGIIVFVLAAISLSAAPRRAQRAVR